MSKAETFDIFAPENQDALWRIMREMIASLDGLAIAEFHQDYPEDRTIHPPYQYTQRRFVFADGGEIMIKNAKRVLGPEILGSLSIRDRRP